MQAPSIIRIIIRVLFVDRSALIAENLALRQQLVTLSRSARRPRLRQRDRIFWVWISKLWRGWRSSLVVVQPDTVVRWHRRGFKLYWRWKSHRRGRPALDREMRGLIRRASRDNPRRSAERVRDALLLLSCSPPCGHTIRKCLLKPRKPRQPSTT